MSWAFWFTLAIYLGVFLLSEWLRQEPREIGDFEFPKSDGPVPINHDPIVKGPNIVWSMDMGVKKREPPEDDPLDTMNPWRYEE